jgi:Transposase zinc-ribbon domain
MSGLFAFMDRYRDEAACVARLAQLRWSDGFVCDGCAGRAAYQLAVRPRVSECAGCGPQHSVTAGMVFHRTRTRSSSPHRGSQVKLIRARQFGPPSGRP